MSLFIGIFIPFSLFLSIASAKSEGKPANLDDFHRIDVIKQEEPCVNAGGNCVIAADCADAIIDEDSGLCPKQRMLGIECCTGFSEKETRCVKRGGFCLDEANTCTGTVYKEATDCEASTSCCITASTN